MALRDKLVERVQPMLEPGEQIQQVFMARGGPNPMWGLLTAWVAFAAKYRIVAVTDRGVVVFKAGSFVPTKPSVLLGRSPRHVFGPVSGVWAKCTVGPEQLWVHKRFHKDVEAADAGTAAISR